MEYSEVFIHCHVKMLMKKLLINIICLLVVFGSLYSCGSKSKSLLKVTSFFGDSTFSTNIKCEGWFTTQSVLFEAEDLSITNILNEITAHSNNIYEVVSLSEQAILIKQNISVSKSRYYMICKTNTNERFFAFDMCLDLDGLFKNDPIFCKIIFPYQFSNSLTNEILINKEPISLSWDWNDDILLNDGISIEDIQDFYSSLGMYKLVETQNGFVLQENEFLPISLNFHIKTTEDDRNVIVIYPIN